MAASRNASADALGPHRVSFARIQEPLEVPNLLALQTESFDWLLGNDKWSTKSTVAQDLGQGATGTTSTTISVEATDEVPAPFYKGTIETEDGEIDASQGSQVIG